MQNIKKNLPIGVFDSGVGGLSVLTELKRAMPHEDFIFLADQLYVPYGEKTKKELVNLCYRITDYFLEKQNIKMLVVACNTATCGAIEELRRKYSFPIVGTEPAVKPAAIETKTKSIAIISTPFTSESYTLKKLIKNYCQGLEVMNIGCPHLENTVEEGKLDGPVINTLLSKFLKDIKNSNVDALVLGCTHYPFLKKAIRKTMKRRIMLLDGGRGIALRTKKLIKQYGLDNKNKKKGGTIYLTTGETKKFEKVASTLLRKKIKGQKVRI